METSHIVIGALHHNHLETPKHRHLTMHLNQAKLTLLLVLAHKENFVFFCCKLNR